MGGPKFRAFFLSPAAKFVLFLFVSLWVHTTAREPKSGFLRVPVFKNTTEIQRRDPREGEKRKETGGGRGKKKKRNSGRFGRAVRERSSKPQQATTSQQQQPTENQQQTNSKPQTNRKQKTTLPHHEPPAHPQMRYMRVFFLSRLESHVWLNVCVPVRYSPSTPRQVMVPRGTLHDP